MTRRFKPTREFHIRKGAVRFADTASTAVVYLKDEGGHVTLMGFSGKRAKFDFYYRYCDAAAAEKKAKWFFDAVQRTEASRVRRTADRKVEQAAPVKVAFEVGKTYTDRSIGDHNCIFSFTVVRRTAKFITLDEVQGDKNKRVGVQVWEGVETAKPFGTYSMCAVIRADRLGE